MASPAQVLRELAEEASEAAEGVVVLGRIQASRERIEVRSPEAADALDLLVVRARALLVEADEAMDTAMHVEAAACGLPRCLCGQECGQ